MPAYSATSGSQFSRLPWSLLHTVDALCLSLSSSIMPRWVHEMRTIVPDDPVAWCVCQSVCHRLHPATRSAVADADKLSDATKQSFLCCAVKSCPLVNDCNLLDGFSTFTYRSSIWHGHSEGGSARAIGLIICLVRENKNGWATIW